MENMRGRERSQSGEKNKKKVLVLEEAYKNKIKFRSLIPSPSVKVSKEDLIISHAPQ